MENLRPGAPRTTRGTFPPASPTSVFEIVPKHKRTGQDLWAGSPGPSSWNPVSLQPLLFLDSLKGFLQAEGREGELFLQRTGLTQTSVPGFILVGCVYFHL